MVMKKIILSLLAGSLLLVFSNLSGQNLIMLKGKVIDKQSGESIIGCTVIEYDEDKRVIGGTITDVNGNYILKVKSQSSSIMFSFIGYTSYEIPLENNRIINAELEPTTIGLDEVVVVAHVDNEDPLSNIAQRDVTSSRVKINMDESVHLGAVSAEEALQGKVSGLDVLSSGDPGGGSQMVIRGMGSLGNSQPLIVIDGVPQNIRIGSSFDFGSADGEDIGNLVNIAPQDMKSIDVLKDAASAAQWGSAGADGVLIIQTVRGRKGKTRFDYQGKYTVNVQPSPIPMLNGNEYSMLQLEELHNSRGEFDIPPEIAYSTDYIDFYNYSANTNWVEEVTQTGIINDQYFKVSGGGEKTGYFASVNFLESEGTTINTALKRFTTRVNLDYNVSRKIRFSTNFSYSNSITDGNYIFDEWARTPLNIRKMAYMKAPNMSIWEHNRTGDLTGEYFTPIESYQGNGDDYFNPVAIGNLSDNDKTDNKVSTSFILNYKIFKWLRFQQLVSFQYNDLKRNQFIPSNAIGTDWLNRLNNYSNEQNSSGSQLTSRSQLYFTPTLSSAHFISGMLMAEIEQGSSEWTAVQGINGPNSIVKDPASNPQIGWMGSSQSESRALGFMGNFNYKYKDRYMSTLNMRVDGSSKFGSSNRWGLFPSLSFGWRFSEEEWMKRFSFLGDSKLRFSWGITGKQPGGSYDRHAIYNTPSGGIASQYIYNQIIVPVQIQLDNLKWQSVSSFNLGIDLSFLEQRITVTGEIYTKETKDILWRNYKIPLSSGADRLKWFNGGVMQNQGWELFISGYPVKSENWQWNVSFNIANNRNMFLEFPDNFNNEVETNIGNGQYPRRADIGKPIGSFYGFKYLGVWPSDDAVVVKDKNGNIRTDANGKPIPLSFNGTYTFVGGDAIYEDVNHDGNIDLLDVQKLGDSNPDFLGGFGSTLKWKNLKLNLNFNYRVGFQIVNEIALVTEGMGDRNNQSKAVLHRWREQGQDEEGMLPRAYMAHPANNLGSDRYVEQGDFLRLGNLTFSYGLGRNICRKLKINSAEIAITMRRIMTFTNYTGQDPEIRSRVLDPFWFGTDNGATPPPKDFTISIAFGF
jgi:TonB-linked SusC/RagA family outer membrane protein